MTLYKIHFQCSILYDTYGNPFGVPVLLIEDVFSTFQNETDFLMKSQNRKFQVTHIKKINFNNVDSAEYSLLDSTLKSLEEIIIGSASKIIIISEGFSCTLALHLSMTHPSKINSSYLINPEFCLRKNDYNPAFAFWDWYSKKFEFLPNLAKFPFLLDFYLKFSNFSERIYNHEQDFSNHIIFSARPTESNVEKSRFLGKKNTISILDQNFESTTILNSPVFQKLMIWFLEKDHLQITDT